MQANFPFVSTVGWRYERSVVRPVQVQAAHELCSGTPMRHVRSIRSGRWRTVKRPIASSYGKGRTQKHVLNVKHLLRRMEDGIVEEPLAVGRAFSLRLAAIT